MKTLLLTLMDSGTTWLETDDAFAVLFAGDPKTLDVVRELAPGKALFFDAPGDTETAPRKTYRVRRLWISDRATYDVSDVFGAVLALAVFMAGVVGMTGCAADRAQFSNLGTSAQPNATAAFVICYSCEKVIYKGDSYGAVMNASKSDGFYFRDKKTHKYMEITGNCVISYGGAS